MDLNLKDRVAVVTGGAAGIGEAIARALAAEGCRVSILDRNEDAARKLAESLGGGAQFVAANVGEPSSVANAFAQLLARDNRSTFSSMQRAFFQLDLLLICRPRSGSASTKSIFPACCIASSQRYHSCASRDAAE